jgi:hypothetical protein
MVTAAFIAISRSSRLGPGMMRSTAQKARKKRQTEAKSQELTIKNLLVKTHGPLGNSRPDPGA